MTPAVATAFVKFAPVNGWALVLAIVMVGHCYFLWKWLKPDPAAVRRFFYELVSSVDAQGRERGDLRKFAAVVFIGLGVFLVIRGALVGTTDVGVLGQILGFVSILLGLGVYAQASKGETEAAVQKAKSDAATALLPKPKQEVEITNDAAHPVPTKATGASVDIPLPD